MRRLNNDIVWIKRNAPITKIFEKKVLTCPSIEINLEEGKFKNKRS